MANTEYDRYPDGVRYETEREIVSSLPNGVQNVYDASAERPTRSKNRHKVSINSHVYEILRSFFFIPFNVRIFSQPSNPSALPKEKQFS